MTKLKTVEELCLQKIIASMARMQTLAKCQKGQGTTEYAILVGVLVVIAMVAIMLFKPKLEELWNGIATGINGL